MRSIDDSAFDAYVLNFDVYAIYLRGAIDALTERRDALQRLMGINACDSDFAVALRSIDREIERLRLSLETAAEHTRRWHDE